MKILITGANGLLGEALSAYAKIVGFQILESENLLIGTDSLVIRTSWLYSENRVLEKQAYATNEIARLTYCGDVWEFIIMALKEDLHGLYQVCGPDILSRYEQARSLFGRVEKQDLPVPNINHYPQRKVLNILRNMIRI